MGSPTGSSAGDERRQFGHRIAGFQVVSHRIADMKLRLEAGRLPLYRACVCLNRSEAEPMDGALSRLASHARTRTGHHRAPGQMWSTAPATPASLSGSAGAPPGFVRSRCTGSPGRGR
ncbi:acyl-CoA dehydrogenase family protein [Streptomyces sp. NPDC003006]